MNVLLTLTMTCPTCGVHLNWLPESVNERRKIEHPKLVGTEYCEYYGKVFLAPVLELKVASVRSTISRTTSTSRRCMSLRAVSIRS